MDTKEQIIASIDAIDDECFVTEMEILVALADSYEKSLLIMENCGDYDHSFITFQEGEILDKATGKGKDEGFIKKAGLFIFRLIGAIIDAIKSKINKKRVKNVELKQMTDKEIHKRERELTKEIKELEKEKEEKRKSPFYKAIIGAGIACTITAAGVAVYNIIDYSEAVEFKDDVKFQISEEGKLRIVFPYYKIEQINKFNKDIDPKIEKAKAAVASKKYDISTFSDILKSFRGIVTNQARIMQREFTIDEYNEFVNDCKKTFETFANKLKEIQDIYKSLPENEQKSFANSNFVSDLKALLKKTPGDIELITKLDEKICKFYEIITNPDTASKHQQKKALKYKFEPVASQNIVDFWSIDNHHLMDAIKKLNEVYKKADGSLDSSVVRKYPEFSDALHDIEKQFNAKIVWKVKDRIGGQTDTHSVKRGIENVSISKSKGFDLGNAELHINVDPGYVAAAVANGYSKIDKEYAKPFGQIFCSIICHEIFHNIAVLTNVYKSNFTHAVEGALAKVFVTFEEIKNLIFKLINEYNSQMTKVFDNKFKPNKKAADITAKRLAYVFARCDSEEKLKSFTAAVNSDTDKDMLDKVSMEDLMRDIDVREKGKGASGSLNAEVNFYAPIFRACLSAILLRYNFMLGGLCAVSAMFVTTWQTIRTKMEGTNEEQMCDMCAAMYKLPVYLQDVRYLMANGKIRKNMAGSGNKHDVHPSTYDRQTISYEIARKMLDSGEKFEPEIKEYLEFIVEKNKGIDLTERKFTKKQMKKSAPEFNKNVRDAVNAFIQKNNIPVKEYAIFDYE